MQIDIIGLGGIGSNLVVPLLKTIKIHQLKHPEEFFKIIIVDGDKVEEGNLTRQYFYPQDIGKNKATITASFLSQLVSQFSINNINIQAISEYLKKDNISIIESKDIVFVGVDNYVTRKLIEDHTQTLEEIFVIFGGNEYYDGDVNILHKEKGEYKTPLLTEKHPEIKEKDKNPYEMTCEEALVSAPQLLLTNMAVCQYMLEGFYNFLIEDKIVWNEKMFDIFTGKVRICNT